DHHRQRHRHPRLPRRRDPRGRGEPGRGGAARGTRAVNGRAGGSGENGRAPRPRLANPYDLGTWSATSASTAPPGSEGPAERARPVGPAPERDAASPARRAPRTLPLASPAPGAPSPAREAPGGFFVPPELPTPPDPFELARRTFNRSRAAARDRGLFPISAKTQARDVRDRSGRSPGYSGSRPDPRDPQGI